MKHSKIVQIVVIPETENHYHEMYVLTDDGQIFKKIMIPNEEYSSWTKVITPIEQFYEKQTTQGD